MDKLTDEEFEAVIEEALDAIPDKFLEALENIVVVWEEEPNSYHLGEDGEDAEAWEPADDEADDWDEAWDDAPYGTYCGDELLGLFDGLSLEEQADGYDDLPNVITIFKGPHERCFDTREEMVTEIGKTVVHELGHYFGLDDEKLYAMGY